MNVLENTNEIHSVVVWRVEIDLISVWGVGDDLVFVRRSKMTCFRVWI